MLRARRRHPAWFRRGRPRRRRTYSAARCRLISRPAAPGANGTKPGELAEPRSDPAHDRSLMTSELVRPIRVELFAQQHPRGQSEGDATHAVRGRRRCRAGSIRCRRRSAPGPKRVGAPAPCGETRATNGCVFAHALSDCVNRFSPTPTRIGTSVAGGLVQEELSVTSNARAASASVSTQTFTGPIRSATSGPERRGFVEPPQPVGVEPLQRFRQRPVDT